MTRRRGSPVVTALIKADGRHDRSPRKPQGDTRKVAARNRESRAYRPDRRRGSGSFSAGTGTTTVFSSERTAALVPVNAARVRRKERGGVARGGTRAPLSIRRDGGVSGVARVRWGPTKLGDLRDVAGKWKVPVATPPRQGCSQMTKKVTNCYKINIITQNG